MPRRRRRRRRRRVRRFRANQGARACTVTEGNVLRCDPLSGFGVSGLGTFDLWEETLSEADGIDVFEVEDEYED